SATRIRCLGQRGGSRGEQDDCERVMLNGSAQAAKTKAVLLTTDGEFAQSVRTTFASSGGIELSVANGGIAANAALDFAAAAVGVPDFGWTRRGYFPACRRRVARLGGGPPLIVVTQSFSETVARQLLQVRVADFLIKPVEPIDLVRACARVAQQASGTEAVKE